MAEKTVYNNLIKVNKPLYIMGLSMMYFYIAVFSLLIFILFSTLILKSIVVTISVLVVCLIPGYIIFSQCAKENKQGEPDYLKSSTSYARMKKEFIDDNNILSHIYEGKK
jgi:hypothetical protein